MILIEMLESVNGNQYALWQCKVCGVSIKLGYTVGKNLGCCKFCRTTYGVRHYNKLSQAVRDRKKQAKRLCLMCGEEFLSPSAGHRRCGKCRDWVEVNQDTHAFRRGLKTFDPGMARNRIESDEDLVKTICY